MIRSLLTLRKLFHAAKEHRQVEDGIALQIIDDITDLYEDIENSNHNYLLSIIHHEGNKVEQRNHWCCPGF
jgi:hypothetical protein